LPTGWACQNEEQNLVCLDKTEKSQKNSAIVFSFKIRSAEDSLAVFRDQLARPRTLYQGDMASPSLPKGVKDRTINSNLWVEGIHIGSEIPEYYTHYLATVSGEYAVLISFSALQSQYQQAMAVLEPVINSLKLTLPQTQNDLAGGGPIVNPFSSADGGGSENNTVLSKNEIVVFGFRIPRTYAYLGGAAIFVLLLLGYAVFSD
jgi:hypothetical protein